MVWVSYGLRCAVGIGGKDVAWVAGLCLEIGGEGVTGGAVPSELAEKASHGWRCAVGIGEKDVVWASGIDGEGVAWVLCHCVWRRRRPMGGAMPLELVGKASLA